MNDFQLGQHVSYTQHIVRRDSLPGEFNGPNRIWTNQLYPGRKTQGGEGIIVGKRTLSNGNAHWIGYDGPTAYKPTEHFTAFLVAHDLHRRPVYVRPEDITATRPVGATNTTQEPTP